MIAAILTFLGAVLGFVGRVLLILLLVVLAVVLFALLAPFCADISWRDGVLKIRAGVCGLTFPVLTSPKPEPPPAPEKPAEPSAPPKGFWAKWRAWLREKRKEQKEKRAARRAAKKAARQKAKQDAPAKPKATAKKKAKITLEILCTILQGAGALVRAVFGSLRFTHIRVHLPVSGADAGNAGYQYGQANAWLYGCLGFLDRFLYLGFDELTLEPDLGNRPEPPEQYVSLRISARLLMVFIAAIRILIEFWRKKVFDLFL